MRSSRRLVTGSRLLDGIPFASTGVGACGRLRGCSEVSSSICAFFVRGALSRFGGRSTRTLSGAIVVVSTRNKKGICAYCRPELVNVARLHAVDPACHLDQAPLPTCWVLLL